MGSVYQATQLSVDRVVALKEMVVEIPEGEARQAAVRQFHTEAQLLFSLEHPALPRLFDFFDHAGKYYLAMELVKGCTLEAYIAVNPIAEDQAMDWAQQLCSVLHYLHTHNPPVIFRDLKPSNVMVTHDKRIKLIDFGIAKVWDVEDTGPQTRTAIRGACSPGYAAPEQYGGGTDQRTDLYALGATLYTALTRTIPPQSVDLASGRCKLPPLSELRPDLSQRTLTLVDSLMKLRLSERPQSAWDVMQAFSMPPPSVSLPPASAGPRTNQRPANQTLLKRPKGNRVKTTRIDSVGQPERPMWQVVASAFASVVAAAALAVSLLGNHATRNQAGAAAPGKSPTAPVAAATPSSSALLAATSVSSVPPPPALSPSPSQPATTQVPSSVPLQRTISADPPDTRLYVGDALVGTVGPQPQPLQFLPGDYRLTFKHDGYKTETRDIHVDAQGASDPLVVTLAPMLSRIKVSGPPGAEIAIDDKAVGKAPLLSPELTPNVKHVVRATRAGFKTAEKGVTLKPGEEVAVRLTLEPLAARPVAHVAEYPTYYPPSHVAHHVSSGAPPRYYHHRPGTVQIPHVAMPDHAHVVRIPHHY